MSVHTQEINESFIIVVDGELDQTATQLLDAAIQQAVAAHQQSIWVDCAGLRSICTSALRLILAHLSTLHERGTSLVLYHVESTIRSRLEDSGLTSLLTIVPTIKEAYLLGKHQH
ncbi:STAS domain-containing protein [Pontibacter ruber]|uniref:STAS domain-containing protein n=1 Tax=Pontibacter ruber TaxID=1343895 RepID=A0ABW5D1C4_9BACT|nr:STAS domain-containing protein [Pontibacter ruber]